MSVSEKILQLEETRVQILQRETRERKSADAAMLAQIEKNTGDISFLMEIVNDTEWVTVEGNNQTVSIPSGARQYAQILELHGRWAVYPVNGYYCDYVKNYPKRILADDGRVLLELPDGIEKTLPDFGIAGNYISFSDGRAIYHRGAKVVEYFYEVQDGERESGDYCYDSYKIVYLAKAEVEEIDASDLIPSDGIIDIEGASGLTIDMRYSEEEVRAMIYDPDNVEMSEFNYGVGKTKFAFEV